MFILVIRTAILYFYLIFIMRIMGKRQIGQLEPVDLVVALMISELASLPMADNRMPLVYSIVPITTLVFFQMTTSFIELKSEYFRSLLNGEPSILIKDGIVNIKELRHLRYNLDDLLEELRAKGYFNIRDVHYAILETNGNLSIIPKNYCSPPNREDIKIKVADEPLPTPLVLDGNINYKNLELLNLDESWLLKELKNKRIMDIKDVFVAIVYSKDNKLYIQSKDKEFKKN